MALVRIDDWSGILARQGQPTALAAWNATAQFLQASVREMDVVAKYADTSFALLLPGASVTDLLHIADRIRQTVAGSELAGPAGPFTFTVSVAAATPMKSDETQVFLWRAEEALDAAQKAGGNCCYFHNGQRPETSAAALQQAGAPVA